jgi:Copper transport outer membrane protein, MctB
MFDLRYHVVSLAAVFIALVIGILVGAALASHGLGNTERKRLEEDLRRAESRVDILNAQVDALNDGRAADAAFVDGTYESVMANRLKGKKIAVLFVGSSDDKHRSQVVRALADANAGAPLRLRFIKVPIDPASLARRLAKRPFLAAYSGRDQLSNLGRALGEEFAAGTDTPLWNALQNVIVEEKLGPSKQPADGVVIVRTAPPQQGPTALFLKGLYAGVADVGIPVVGIERSDDDGSAIKAFQNAGLSTVDDIDGRVGKLALVALLSDPMLNGNYGTKKSAKAQLPPIASLPATSG